MPLGVVEGIHCKVTELEVTEAASNEYGSLGTENMQYTNYYSIISATVKHKISTLCCFWELTRKLLTLHIN